MKEKQLQDHLNRLFEKAKSKNRHCLWNDCQSPAINSHILQKNGILSRISENGHVYVVKTDFLNPDLFTFKRTGINVTYTFKGFCKEHDNSIFLPIEQNNLDFENYKCQLLFAYRTLLNEKRKKEILIDFHNAQLECEEIKSFVNRDFLKQVNEQNQLSLGDLGYYEKILLSNLETNDEDFIFFTRYLKPFDVCLSSHFTHETTRQRMNHIEKTGHDFKLLTDIYISYFPLEGKNILVMGYLKSQKDICGDYISKLYTFEESELSIEISNLMLGRCEEWACSQKFHEDHIKGRESTILDGMIHVITTIDEDIRIKFNYFE